MKKKKILIIGNTCEGGARTFLSNILRLKNYSVSTCFVTVSHVENKQIDHYLHNNANKKVNYTYNPLRYLLLVREVIWIRKVIEEEKPDLLVTIDVHACLLAIFGRGIFFRKNINIVATVHNNVAFIIRERIPLIFRLPLRFFCILMFRYVDCFVCVSSQLAHNFRAYFSVNNIKVIPNGVVVGSSSFGTIDRNEGKLFDRDNIIIISAGRFEKQKDFPTLLKAFSIAKRRIKNSKLILLGSGSQEEMLKKIARKLDLNKDVHFLGWKTNIFPYLKRARLFVLSTHYEGFGYVLLEAMSLGVPVIATDAPFGPSEILGNGRYGILVPLSSSHEMADAIVRILMDKRLYIRYVSSGKKRVKNFTQKRMITSYSRLFKLHIHKKSIA